MANGVIVDHRDPVRERSVIRDRNAIPFSGATSLDTVALLVALLRRGPRCRLSVEFAQPRDHLRPERDMRRPRRRAFRGGRVGHG